MLDDLWELVKIVCGPFVFAAKILATCWKGFRSVTSAVFSFICKLAAPGFALWQSWGSSPWQFWESSRAVVSPNSTDDVNVDILHNVKNSDGHMQLRGQQFTMPVDEFANWDFSGMSHETHQFGNAIQTILNDGDSVSIRYEK